MPLPYRFQVVAVLFFFSSRRRHTRLQGDWSSDVCSSDLPACPPGAAWLQCWLTWLKSSPCRSGLDPGQVVQALVVGEGALGLGLHRIGVLVDADELLHHEIGRAHV